MSARRRRATRALLACLGCCLVALQTACGGGRLDALGPDALVVAFGDSLTAGNGVAPERAYPAVLASLSGRRVVNAGVSGKTTGELAEAHDVPLESGIVSRLLVRSAMKSDAVHFNEAGYAALAEAVHALLEDEGAL